MKIKNIRIQNYKSIKDCTIPIKNNLLCFVGKNESGKSNILEAIKFIDLNNQFAKNDINKIAEEQGKKYPVTYFVFEIPKVESKAILKFLKSKTYINQDLVSVIKKDFTFLDLLRWGNGLNTVKYILYNDSEQINIIDAIKDKKKIAVLIKELHEEFIPHVELFSDEELELEAATITELKGRSRKFNTFRKLLFISGCKNLDLIDLNLESGDRIANRLATYQKNATKLFRDYYFQDESIEFNFIHVGEKISLSINDSTGSYYSISERSPGFRYFFSFLVNKISLTKQREKLNIFLLDEPAKGLHPKGSRDFINLLSKIENSQILFNTHNPFLILRDDLDSLVLLKKDSTKGTVVDLKPYRNNYQVLRRELGMLLYDSFLVGETNLTVEGATEKYCLSLVFNDLVKNSEIPIELEWVNIFDCGGVTETKVALNYLAKTLNLRGVILLDSDKEADDVLKHKKNKLINDLVTSDDWALIRLNDIFTDKEKQRTFEDLFPQELYIEMYNQYCTDLDIFDKTFEPFKYGTQIEQPLINMLNDHFKSFFNDDNRKGKSINKVHITRLIFDSIPQPQWKTKLPFLYNLAEKINTSILKIDHG